MMKKLSLLIILIISIFCCRISFATENVFYVLHSSPKHPEGLQATLSTIQSHADAIQVIVSQAYQINDKGKVSGYINQELVDLTAAKHIKLMAMVTNAGFDQKKAHTFLSSKKAQIQALNELLANCKQYHLYGVQFDFEMISIKDKKALTQFFNLAAKHLHQAGFAVSYAIIPTIDEKSSLFLQKSYENWSGAYDLKALGKSGDFITIMAYNQHAEGTTPGPAASVHWVEIAIQKALKEMPAYKISLGIPAYSLYWFTGSASASSKRVTTQRREIDYQYATQIINKNHSNLTWDNLNKVNYSIYQKNWLNEYIYLEDATSFKAKLALAQKYHLRGVSVFRIGTEDTRIWVLLGDKIIRA